MLQKLAHHIADAHIRAAEWRERAKKAPDEWVRGESLRFARSWEHLAKSYEFVESLERFLLDVHKNKLPFEIERLPKPPRED